LTLEGFVEAGPSCVYHVICALRCLIGLIQNFAHPTYYLVNFGQWKDRYSSVSVSIWLVIELGRDITPLKKCLTWSNTYMDATHSPFKRAFQKFQKKHFF